MASYISYIEILKPLDPGLCGHEFPPFQRMEYSEAMERFGIDKPDLRYDMELVEITSVAKGKNFKAFIGFCDRMSSI